jgi:hypothetical protein
MGQNVRFGSKADINTDLEDVCFAPESGQESTGQGYGPEEGSTKRQLCVGRSESMTNSLFSKLLPLFPHLEFPVPMRREFRRKPPDFRLIKGVPTLQGPDFRQISLYFSLL